MIDYEYDDVLFEDDIANNTDEREEDEWPFGIPHDVLMELIGKDG